ncbi:hypothetical protein JYU14_00350 [Simkania negevensis]|uniref:Lipoprotein n=1 Tax=Simkania negevensis TaxID=83561 RepID=A0ABS3AR20_9BACT|nr:hypothetical protein [Simkania negevensis]
MITRSLHAEGVHLAGLGNRYLLRGCLLLFLVLIGLCAGCQRTVLDVRHERLDKDYLASARVGTPESHLYEHFNAEQLVVFWDIPAAVPLVNHQVEVRLFVRFFNREEDEVVIPVLRRGGHKVVRYTEEELAGKRGIMSFRAVLSSEGEELAAWEHQIWVELIQFEPVDFSRKKRGGNEG